MYGFVTLNLANAFEHADTPFVMNSRKYIFIGDVVSRLVQMGNGRFISFQPTVSQDIIDTNCDKIVKLVLLQVCEVMHCRDGKRKDPDQTLTYPQETQIGYSNYDDPTIIEIQEVDVCLKSTVEVIGYFGGILKTGQKEKVKVKMDKSLYDVLNNYRPGNMLLDIESLVYKDGTGTILTDEKDESDAASTSVIKKRQAQSVVDEETNDPEMLPPPPPRKARVFKL